ncbi:hypothetical protein A9D12_07515 [Erythrobacter neustonensis]|uniref:Uncharacterized protein n=1 Tax=Erythrobacter neustonensis TaxID=1112 RepID=A0A192D2V8_9SPHN|nr:hypothetical protein A9D12_07515 [Erythrobacter neustonensis]
MHRESASADDLQDEELVAFSSVQHPHEEYRFAANSQISVIAMGVLSALSAVLLLAGIEAALTYSIASGWIDAPPGPEFYASLVKRS